LVSNKQLGYRHGATGHYRVCWVLGV